MHVSSAMYILLTTQSNTTITNITFKLNEEENNTH